MCFVRCDFEKKTLLCKRLITKTTAEEIFHLMDNYISWFDIEWKKCVRLSSEETLSMVGSS